MADIPFLYLQWNTDVATTRKSVPSAKRKIGLTIAYKNPDNSNVTVERYEGTYTTDTYWPTDSSWVTLSNYIFYRKESEYANRAAMLDSIPSKVRKKGLLLVHEDTEGNVALRIYTNDSTAYAQWVAISNWRSFVDSVQIQDYYTKTETEEKISGLTNDKFFDMKLEDWGVTIL